MSPRLRPVWVLAAAVVLVVAGCGTSADPDTWEEAEEDARFVEAEFTDDAGNTLEFSAASAVEHNFMQGCLTANTRSLTLAEARVLCRCSFDGLRERLKLPEFKSLDNALRSNPNPSDLEEDPEDSWDDTAEDILRACAARVDS